MYALNLLSDWLFVIYSDVIGWMATHSYFGSSQTVKTATTNKQKDCVDGS